MKGAMKKLVVSVFVLIVAVSLATASTFAWFTMNNTVRVDAFNVDVSVSDGLTVAVVANEITAWDDIPLTRYKAAISADDIKTVYGGASYIETGKDFFASKSLKPVTTEVGAGLNLDFMQLDMSVASTPDFTQDLTKVSTGLELAGADLSQAKEMLSFVLYFKSTGDTTTAINQIVLRGDSTLTKVTSTSVEGKVVPAWKAITAGDYGTHADSFAIDEPITGVMAQNAVRIGFVDVTTPATPVNMGIWDPHPTSDFDKNTPTTVNLALDYFNYFYNFTGSSKILFPASAAYTKYDLVAMSTVGTGGAGIPDHPVVKLTETTTAGTWIGKMRVNLWLEGWDSECFDTIMTNTITTVMQFVGYHV